MNVNLKYIKISCKLEKYMEIYIMSRFFTKVAKAWPVSAPPMTPKGEEAAASAAEETIQQSRLMINIKIYYSKQREIDSIYYSNLSQR